MKKLTYFFSLLMLFSIASCVKDTNQQLLSESAKESDFVTERALLQSSTCNCSYEILDVKSLDFDDFEYSFGNVVFGTSLCSNCQNGLFAGSYDGCDGLVFPSNCGHNFLEPIPNGWFSFNCPVASNSSFVSTLFMDCCDDDPNCTANSQVKGEITFRMRCEPRRIIAENPRAATCSRAFTSQPITIPFDSDDVFASLTTISLEGECGCTPVAQ